MFCKNDPPESERNSKKKMSSSKLTQSPFIERGKLQTAGNKLVDIKIAASIYSKAQSHPQTTLNKKQLNIELKMKMKIQGMEL